ncbi:site-specific DNA-methyltransferase [bacterium]|nr:site-specific DNA-methyltransferase [bacterium]
MAIENKYKFLNGDCLRYLRNGFISDIDLAFVDPPFNQGKNYNYFNDSQPEEKYWDWLRIIIAEIYRISSPGGAIYFMQREKNAENVLRILRDTGWVFQNLIIWKKMTSAIPSRIRYSKHYQIIVYATKGKKPRVFNRLRIDPPKAPHHKYPRENGIYVSDVWDDIRELTSGYFAGDEALRNKEGDRVHTQQSPIALLLRIILTSTLPGDLILDPFAGTGVSSVVAYQLERNSVCIEIDPANVHLIRKRLESKRSIDNIAKYREYYKYTPDINDIWPSIKRSASSKRKLAVPLNIFEDIE